MKNRILFISFAVLALLILIFFPRNVEHGIVVNKTSTSTTFLIDGKTKKFKSVPDYPKLTVVNFKYNLLKSYGFEVLSPVTDRIMTKSSSSYELETIGNVSLSSKAFYYQVDKENNITASAGSKVIVGKTNISYFKDKKGFLKTFLIFPMDYSSMRVGLSTNNFSSLYHNKLEVKALSPAKLYSVRDKLSLDISKDTSVIIEKDGANLKLTVNGESTSYKNRLYLKGESLSVLNITRGSPAFTPSYNGILEFSALNNNVVVVNEVNLEEYLRKVVPSEMPSSGGIESLKCQAIAARTYAISDMLANRYASLGFYVDDSTQSQVYNNILPNELSTAAVDSTNGVIMAYDGKPIDAKYYSTSAGTGVNFSDIWFNADGTSEIRPYLTTNNYLTPKKDLPKTEDGWLNFYKSTDLKALDSNYPYFRWKVDYSYKGLTTGLNKSLKILYDKRKDYLTISENGKIVKNLPELKNLKDIKIIKRSEGGNIIEISFIFENATVDVKSDSSIRSALRVNSEFTGESNPIVRYKDKPITNGNFLPSSFFSVDMTKDKVTLYGGGYGHGVGMSQYAAMELSKKGLNYKDILNTFYKNITLDKIY